jgi:tetratricopeptide (TPR) repeat protein
MTGQQSSLEVPTDAGGSEQRRRVAVVCLVLAAITFAVFGQTLAHGFIDYDDNIYVYGNPVVARGLTLKGIVWAFTTVHADNWHPLTWLSHMLDCQLYGLHPGGHHLTNVLLHTATVIALFLVLRRMTGALWRSAFVAAVFAIHPLRVESVAWVAERKDVLSGLFFMLTIGVYVRYVDECKVQSAKRKLFYLSVIVLFALGLMAKPMLVTLPFVLLLLDYWPLQRVEPGKLSGLVMEKLPLLALSAASCVATLLAQNRAIQPTGAYSLPLRCANALVTCMVYLCQMVWPAGLAVYYPYPNDGLPTWEVALAGTLLAGLSAAAWARRRKQPWLLVGWVWYLVMLLPVVGVIQVGGQAHADRYTCLPQIGIYVAVTWLAAEWRLSREALGGLMAGVLAVLMLCASTQTAYWKDGETLWTHTISCTTGNAMAYNSLGLVYREKGEVDKAIICFQKALQIHVDFIDARNNLGLALMQNGQLDKAISCYQDALELQPRNAVIHLNLGNALVKMGRVDEAIAHYQRALEIKPDYPEARNNLGSAFRQKGCLDDAITQYQNTLRINPANAGADVNLGELLLQKGSVDNGILHFQHALQIEPDLAEAHYGLGNAFCQKGRLDEAITHFQRALQIRPDYAKAQNNLGNALLEKGSVSDAIIHYQKALEIQPADSVIQNNLAWLLATCPQASLRNGARAVELARQANNPAGGENPFNLRTLAAAYAETGRFSEAVETAQRALRMAGAQSNTTLAGQLQLELKLYQAGRPFHRPEQTH